MEIVRLPLRDGSEYEISPDFLAELNQLFFGVETELYRMRLWCMANPDRRKTKRGARRFVFNWINKACQIKPKPRAEHTSPPIHPVQESREVRQEQLAKLKRALA